MNTASARTPTMLVHESFKNTEGEDHIPRSARIAVRRALSNVCSLWRLCEKAACRRAGCCKGGPDQCLGSWTPLLATAVISGGIGTLAGKQEGLSFDELYARHPNEIMALARWNDRLDGQFLSPQAPRGERDNGRRGERLATPDRRR